MKKNLLLFVIIFLAVNLVINFFFKEQPIDKQDVGVVSIKTTKNDFAVNDVVTIEIKNNTNAAVTFKTQCPEEPFDVLYMKNGIWVEKKHRAEINCATASDYVIKPGDKALIDYASWNHSLFSELGKYKIRASSIESNEFEIKPEGLFSYFWITLFYQPLYNTLIFLVNIAPGHDLGFGIILLTILIRTILLIPSQNALKSQRKMQDLQPKLNKIREKYKDNQQMMTTETYALWKEHKVNPFGSCLPLIIQFPILIALFYVVQNGLNPDNSYLLYGSLRNFSYSSIQVIFLNLLDLTKINYYLLPLIVGGLQFLQMKLAVIRTKSTKEIASKGQELAQKQKAPGGEMEVANKMMLYIMPVMIAVFTASVPAGVGIYWCVSTLYGIFQQLVVNYQSDRSKSAVRVIS